MPRSNLRFGPLSYRVSLAVVLAQVCGAMAQAPKPKPPFRPECNANFGQCGVGQACLIDGGQQGNKLVFKFGGTSNETNKPFDFYNIRRDNNQDETHNGYYVIEPIAPGTIYRISVEGCVSHPLSHSTCSAWVQMSLATFPKGAPPCPPSL